MDKPEEQEHVEAAPGGQDVRTVSGKRVLVLGLLVLAGILLLWKAVGTIQRPPPRPPPTVIAESILMTAAQEATRVGDHESALAALRKHRDRYPGGLLAEQREAATVHTLCSLGRVGELEVARQQFIARFSASPLVPEVRGACREGQAPGAE